MSENLVETYLLIVSMIGTMLLDDNTFVISVFQSVLCTIIKINWSKTAINCINLNFIIITSTMVDVSIFPIFLFNE